MSDFILTIDSDSESPFTAPKPQIGGKPKNSKAKAKAETGKTKGSKRKRAGNDNEEEEEEDDDDGVGGGMKKGAGGEMDAEFTFDGFSGDDPIAAFKKKNAPPRVSIDEIIARHRTGKEGVDDDVAAEGDWAGFSDSEDDEEEDEEEEVEGVDEEDEEDDESEGDMDEEALGDETADLSGEASENGSNLEDDDSESDSNDEADEEVVLDPLSPEEVKAAAAAAVAKAYFDQTNMPFDLATAEELAKDSHDQPFSSLPGSAALSRPILLGLASLSLTTPTPIQRQTIPLALLGKDLVCSSVTGSGKTVGYLVPLLERLLWRDKRGGGKTRVMVLTPTRELAVQVHQVAKALARYTDLAFCLCVGGMNLRVQEGELRTRPDVVIGTPGRVIDHVRNTHGFSLESLEILVIDEADRILEEGFHDELEEIISACPRGRQTMLFSATVTESVADLARLSLDKPVRIKIDPPKATALGLTQEFLRVRDKKGIKELGGEDRLREAVLVAVCRKAFNKGRTIIFFRSKKGAHRMKVIFGLCGLQGEELHGDLTQEQRLTALQRFKEGKASYLLATDLASRGLDIKGVDSVINYETPSQYEVYLHRIGRTARAGRTGRALTLAGETDRKLVKEARKNAPEGTVKQRRVPSELVKEIVRELEQLEETVTGVMEEEIEEKMLRRGEMEVRKGRNLIEHEDEIKGRPARSWFQSEGDKKKSKQAGTASHNASFDTKPDPKAPKRDRFSGLSRAQKRRKLAADEDARDTDAFKAQSASIRAAKKALKPGKIGTAGDLGIDVGKQRKDKKRAKKAGGGREKEGLMSIWGLKGGVQEEMLVALAGVAALGAVEEEEEEEEEAGVGVGEGEGEGEAEEARKAENDLNVVFEIHLPTLAFPYS